MNNLFSRSLLLLIECKLAVPVKVITAESVQRRYQAGKKSARRDIEVAAEFWVLKTDETESFIKVRPFSEKSGNNPDKNGNNPDKSRKNASKEKKGKEMKGEERKGKESLVASAPVFCPVMSQEDYDILVRDYGKETIDKYIRKIGKWQASNRKRVSDGAGLIRKWIAQDGVKKDTFDEDKYAFVINNF